MTLLTALMTNMIICRAPTNLIKVSMCWGCALVIDDVKGVYIETHWLTCDASLILTEQGTNYLANSIKEFKRKTMNAMVHSLSK